MRKKDYKWEIISIVYRKNFDYKWLKFTFFRDLIHFTIYPVYDMMYDICTIL